MKKSNILCRLRLLFPDPRFESPRIWSNKELKKFSHLFTGSVINVSAWRDEDKEGFYYREYFENASDYWISNYKADARGWQENSSQQIYIDLEQSLEKKLIQNFDIVYNHTTLEHVFDVNTAFQNLCMMAKTHVIVVVPFLQEQHGAYGDFWRFTPLCIERLFKINDFSLSYINFNDKPGDAVYIFAIGVRNSISAGEAFIDEENKIGKINEIFIGRKVVRKPSVFSRVIRQLALHLLS